MAALFPCGSITGAPKRKTMEIIQQLEPDRRGIYTGAIGWFDQPNKEATVGDFCLSVAIRTIELGPPGAGGLRSGLMGVGAGILYDSDAEMEFRECELKSRFLTGLEQSFELFETIHFEKANGCRHLDRHLTRLQRSATYFGIRWNEKRLRATIDRFLTDLSIDCAHRLRISLSRSEEIKIESARLERMPGIIKVGLANERLDSNRLLLQHKTSLRTRYDRLLAEAIKEGLFDILFFNERGDLCEGARSNVFVNLSGNWFTPPVSCGLLPGIMRAVMLEDIALAARERVLNREDLFNAKEVFVCNALRGRLDCTIRRRARD
jgi:para-aminobenzoate synthetase/4-amino-4-deoxychorismate lyase